MPPRKHRAGKSTSKSVAAKAAKLMRHPDEDVRDVAASAVSQAEPEPLFTAEEIRAAIEVPAVQVREDSALDRDDLRATILEQCVRGAGSVGFNLSSPAEAVEALRIVGELGDGYSVKAFGSRVEVARVR